MNTENIKDIFEDYIARPSVQYALLVNGPWGSGKTFFWKSKLAPVAVEMGKKVIYVSLNGIRKIEALEHIMFIRMLPYLQKDDKGRKGNFAMILGNLANAASKYFLKNSLSDLLKGASVDMFDYSNTLVCFDDLERCQIPIKEVLGYINDFVEHKNLKTVILADETHILKIPNEQVSYANINEKVIGRVLNFIPEPKDIMPQLFDRFSSVGGFFVFLQDKESYIAAIMEKFGVKNLRMVSFFLDVLEKIFPLFRNEEHFIIDEVICFSASICIEFKSGRLESKDYNDFKELDDLTPYYYSRIMADPKDIDKDNPDEASFIRHYYDTYVGEDISGYHFYPAVYSYILSGYLDRSAFTNDLAKRKPAVVPDHIGAFSRLINYHFRSLENEEFSELTVKVRQYAIEGVYAIYDYLQIADFYFFFSDNNLIDMTNEGVRKFILTGLGLAGQRKEIDVRTFENIMHFKKDNPESEKIKLIIADIHQKVIDEQQQRVGSDLLYLVASADKEKITEIFEENRFSKTFLARIDMKELAASILSGPNRILSILEEILVSRYNSANIGEFLSEDIEPLKWLEQELGLLLGQDDIGQPKKFLLESFLSVLNESWEKLDRTRKK